MRPLLSCNWAALAMAAATFFAATGLFAADRQTLAAHVPKATAGLPSIGRLPANKPIRLAIGFPLRNQDVLTKLLADIYNPASPKYRQFLTPEQFTESFGPTAADYEAVAAFAQANGLHVVARHSNRMLLDLSGSVGEIEKALHVNLLLYSHPQEGRTFFAPDAEPSLDLKTPVLSIDGLSDLDLPHPASLKVMPIPADGPTPAGGSGPGGLYRGNDFRHAYASGVTLNGSGQMVGLLEFDYYYTNDIASYRSQSGIANVP